MKKRSVANFPCNNSQKLGMGPSIMYGAFITYAPGVGRRSIVLCNSIVYYMQNKGGGGPDSMRNCVCI